MKGLILLSISLLVFPFLQVTATVINIPMDYSTIQEGIEASVNNDTVLVWPGIYAEHIDFLGRSIVVVSESGPDVTTIEKLSTGIPIVSFTNGEQRDAKLIGFSIRNSDGAPAVRVRSAGPSIIGNNFYDNYHLSYGGAISIDYSQNPFIKGNTFTNNYANRGAGVDSGIDGAGDIEVTDNVFISNTSGTHGGALLIKNAYINTSKVYQNVFYQNHTLALGGALCISTSAEVAIFNNTVVGNSNDESNHGAGITVWYSSDCIVFNNIVTGSQGIGIYQDFGSGNIAKYNNCWDSWDDYQGIDPGIGAISIDPLFRDIDNGDFHLMAIDCGYSSDSPCIDAGNPNYSEDLGCDLGLGGLRSDMGAYGGVLAACEVYVIGDFNDSGEFNAADIVDSFSKLRTGTPDASHLCECPPGRGNVWASSMDVNNSCSFNVVDVIMGYSKLRTGSPELIPCEDCQPLQY